jgi:hypothetical protein
MFAKVLKCIISDENLDIAIILIFFRAYICTPNFKRPQASSGVQVDRRHLAALSPIALIRPIGTSTEDIFLFWVPVHPSTAAPLQQLQFILSGPGHQSGLQL